MKGFFVISIFILSFAGCGRTHYGDPSDDSTSTLPAQKQTSQNVSNDSSAASTTTPATASDTASSNHVPDIPFESPVVTLPSTSPQSPAPSPTALPQDIPDSAITINKKAPPPPIDPPTRKTTKVVALGTNVKNIKQKLVYDTYSAIKQAKACQKTGTFTDGSRCYILYADGTSELVNDSNRKFITPFIKELEQSIDNYSY